MADKIKVIITDEQKRVKVPKGLRMLIRRCCLAALQLEQHEGSADINVVLTDNEGIASLNGELFGSDPAADSFMVGIGENGAIGTVYVSLERAAVLAEQHNTSLQRETVYLTVHGVLILLNEKYDPSVRAKEERVMFEMGFPLSSAYSISR